MKTKFKNSTKAEIDNIKAKIKAEVANADKAGLFISYIELSYQEYWALRDTYKSDQDIELTGNIGGPRGLRVYGVGVCVEPGQSIFSIIKKWFFKDTNHVFKG